MIAVDTNILVYAHRQDSPWFTRARDVMVSLAEGAGAWAIAWPCLHEFLGIVTHPRIYRPPTPLSRAVEQVEAWLASPSLVLLSESDQYWERLRTILEAGQVAGPLVHDAHIAALCSNNGVKELWSADRDFSRFPGLEVRNPLVG